MGKRMTGRQERKVAAAARFGVSPEQEWCNLLVKLCDTVTREVIDRDGVGLVLRPAYLAFGREVFGRRRRYGSLTLLNELEFVRRKWTSRGLDPRLLGWVEEAVLEALDEHLTSAG